MFKQWSQDLSLFQLFHICTFKMKVSHGNQNIRLVCSRPKGPMTLCNFSTGENSDIDTEHAQTLKLNEKGWAKLSFDNTSIHKNLQKTMYTVGENNPRDQYFMKDQEMIFCRSSQMMTGNCSQYPKTTLSDREWAMVVHIFEDMY